MEIQQNRNSNRIRYAFGEDEVQYSIQDSTGSRSFSVAYSEISRDRHLHRAQRVAPQRRPALDWPRCLMTAIAAIKGQFAPWMGSSSVPVATPSITSAPPISPSCRPEGNLLVIDGDEGQRILQEIESRRADYYRREYDFMPQDETPEQHRNRYKWLYREGVLSEEELKQRLAVIDTPIRRGSRRSRLRARC